MKLSKFFSGALVALLLATPAFAQDRTQSLSARITTNPPALTPGSSLSPLYIDTAGNLRVLNSGGATLTAQNTGNGSAATTATNTGTIVTNTGNTATSVASVATNSGVSAAGLLKSEDAVHASGDNGVELLCVQRATAGAAAGDYENCTVDANGNLRISLAASALTGASSLTVQGVSASTASYVPFSICAGVSAQPTAVTTGRNAVAQCDLVGKVVIKSYSIPELDWQYTSGTAGIVNTTSTAVKAAGAAGIRNFVTGCSYQNISAVASTIAFLDGATVIWAGNAPATMTMPAVVPFPTPLKGTAATAFNVQMGTTATQTMVNCQGYIAP